MKDIGNTKLREKVLNFIENLQKENETAQNDYIAIDQKRKSVYRDLEEDLEHIEQMKQ